MKSKPIRSPKHLEFVRTFPCMIKMYGENCNQQAISHHLTFLKGKRGLSQKVGDCHCISICNIHHHGLHYMGEKKFWPLHGYTLEEVEQYAKYLASISPDEEIRLTTKGD